MRTRSVSHSTQVVVVLMLVALIFGCTDDPKPKKLPFSEEELKEKLINANKNRVSHERVDIDSLVTAKGWNMQQTGTGLRYEVYEPGKGDSVRTDDWVMLDYVITLYNGDTLYTSKTKGPQGFRVGMDHIETGLHEAVTYMKVGDKSRVILPAHLAHGFVGDANAVPSNATLIYHLEVLSVQ